MNKSLTIDQINKILTEHNIGHPPDAIGLRIDNKKYKVDDILPNSRVWADGEITDQYLDGTSAFGYPINEPSIYLCNHAYIVTGDGFSYGEDDGEIIIRNAKVIEILF